MIYFLGWFLDTTEDDRCGRCNGRGWLVLEESDCRRRCRCERCGGSGRDPRE